MVKKIGIILFFVAAVGARHAVPLQDLAFAATQENGQPCPPECVTNSMEIETYYPSPYGYYEELRGDKIIVGDTDNSRIDETHLPPSGTLTFEPLPYAPLSTSGNLYEGSLYYDDSLNKFRFYDGSDWQDVGGGGEGEYWKASTANANDIYYSQSGNVGIGTSDPQAKLHINGNIRIDVAPFSASAVATSNYIPINIQGTVYYLQLYKDAGNVMLVSSSHSVSDCLNANGMLYSVGLNQYTCKFSPAASCPSGWSQYLNWSSTIPSFCDAPSPFCSGQGSSCTTSQHGWGNIPRETCGYPTITYYSNAGCSGCVGCDSTCYATIQEIGCK